MSTVDKYPLPVPEKKQRKARLRRLRQQHRDGHLSLATYLKMQEKVERDYRK